MQTLSSGLLDQLIDAGSWVSYQDFKAKQRCSDVALEDALADLVVEGQAEFRQNVGYRLAGTGLCRRAAQLMRRKGVPAAAVAHRLGMSSPGYRVGVVETVVGRKVSHEFTVEASGPLELQNRMYEFGVTLANPERADAPRKLSWEEQARERVLTGLVASAPRGLGPKEAAQLLEVPVWDVIPHLQALASSGHAQRTPDGFWHATELPPPPPEPAELFFITPQEETWTS